MGKEEKKIEIESSSGINTGDMNVIYQYFNDPANADIANYSIGFIPYIEDKTAGFVGRKFVFNAIDEFIGRNESGYYLIEGEPGIGKTAILAQLSKLRGYPHHFNIAPQNIRFPNQFLGNACAQLIARYDLPLDSIPSSAAEDSNFFLHCLELASKAAKGQSIVFAVDALDETSTIDIGSGVNTLFLPPALPKGVFIIATARPSSDIQLNVSNLEKLYLNTDSDGNLHDIKEYIELFVGADSKINRRINNWDISKEFFTDRLLDKSEGNFIYLKYVLPAISEGEFGGEKFDELPKGLHEYYERHWKKMQLNDKKDFLRLYEPIVAILSVAPEPVSINRLEKWTKIERTEIQFAIDKWMEFLSPPMLEKGERKYRIYHTSFQDFLSQEVDLPKYRNQIADFYMEIVNRME